MRTALLVAASGILLMAVAHPAHAQEADAKACEARMDAWFAGLAEGGDAPEGFGCAVRCVRTTVSSTSDGETSLRAPPERCAARWDYGGSSSAGLVATEVPDAPHLLLLARGGAAGGLALADVLATLLLHTGDPEPGASGA